MRSSREVKPLKIDNRAFAQTVEFVSAAGPCAATNGQITVSCKESVFVRDSAAATAASGRLVAANYTPDAQTLRVTGAGGLQTLALAPQASAEAPIAIPLERYDAFTAEGEFHCEAGRGRVFEADYAVCGPVAPWRGGFATGLNAAAACLNEGIAPAPVRNAFNHTGGVTIEDHFRLLALAGCRVLRLHDCGIWWYALEPQSLPPSPARAGAVRRTGPCGT